MANKKKKEKLKPIEKPFNYRALLKFVLSILLIVFSISKDGIVGKYTHNILSYLFGNFYLVVLISSLLLGFVDSVLKRKYKFNIWFYIGFFLLNITFILLDGYLFYKTEDSLLMDNILNSVKLFPSIQLDEIDFGPGVLGTALAYLAFLGFDKQGSFIMIVVGFALSAIFIIPLGFYHSIMLAMKESREKLAQDLKEKKQQKDEERKAREQQRLAQKQQRLALEKKPNVEEPAKMTNIYADTPNPEKINYEQTEIVDVENKSNFSKTFFIKDKEKPEIKKTKPIKTTNGEYELPPISLLENISGKASMVNKRAAEIKGKKLIEILSNFEIEAELVNVHIGPSVTKFEVKPDASIKVNRINNIQDNIKMELAAKDIRIEAPIPGRNAVGVEIPNEQMVTVRMAELMNNVPIPYKDNKLSFALGKDLMGKARYCELNKMPHLLIAGATGSGKSVCINSIIISYLLRTNPEEVKLVLVDPKKVEFTPYQDIPHLLWPVITDTNVASLMLKKAVQIMEDRYDKFADVQVRDIKSFNEFVDKHNQNLKAEESPMQKLPYIVIIIDELADLMAIAKKDVELSIQRLTQLSRACGMHLIVATQRPSTDVITGLIKSNIPSRISFAVSSSIDSRTILDSVGAEKLLGNGDMLYAPQGENAPIRIQGAFVTDKEINDITSYVKSKASPNYDDKYFELMRNEDTSGAFGFVGEGGNSAKDPIYDEVVEFVKDVQKASTSLLQRKFGIGYNRSARIIDQLEENGIVGPSNGSKPREVYLKKDSGNE